MSARARSFLVFIADVLEGVVTKFLEFTRWAAVTLFNHLLYGKAKYRTRASRAARRTSRTPRPIIHKTVIIRQGQ